MAEIRAIKSITETTEQSRFKVVTQNQSPLRVLDRVISVKCPEGLSLKFNFRTFVDINLNRKYNFEGHVNRKLQVEVIICICITISTFAGGQLA